MREIKLSARLKAVADYVRPGGSVADIGTDHGFIPVYLAQARAAERIIASDISPGPLEAARRTAEAYGVSDKIEFVLAPGLRGVPEHGADTVILAGMGAETIIQILSDAPWTRNARLIIQPQNKPELLLGWLRECGYTMSDASLVKDAGRLYIVMLACMGADTCGAGLMRILRDRQDPLLGEYAASVAKKLEKKLLGLMKGEKKRDNSK